MVSRMLVILETEVKGDVTDAMDAGGEESLLRNNTGERQ